MKKNIGEPSQHKQILKTERLILRPWIDEDYYRFAEISGDKAVMEFYPNLQTTEDSFLMAAKIQSLIVERGWGFWAVEIPEQEPFIGFVGLHRPKDNLPFTPCVEIGWRIAQAHWGKGFATEAANASLNYAFTVLNLKDVVSFTAIPNERSQRVMKKIGMTNTKSNFMHPDIDSSHPLAEHVLYKITKSEWAGS